MAGILTDSLTEGGPGPEVAKTLTSTTLGIFRPWTDSTLSRDVDPDVGFDVGFPDVRHCLQYAHAHMLAQGCVERWATVSVAFPLV